MKRILLDENVPIGLVALLDIVEVAHVHPRVVGCLRYGADRERLRRRLRRAADDRNLPFQQSHRGLALVVVDTNNWAIIRQHAADIRRAVAAAQSRAPTTVSILGRGRPRP